MPELDPRRCADGRFLTTAFVLAALTLLGCEEDLAPRDHSEAPFSMYGVLSPQLDTQSVRVYALENVLTLSSPDPLDAVLTSTDLTTGEVRTWTQTVVAEPNGQYEHLFHAPFRAEYDRWYRLEITRRADGVSSHAEVKVPPEVSVELLDLESGVLPLYIEGERVRILKPEITYTLQLTQDSRSPVLSYVFSYQGQEYPFAEGWKIDVELFQDRIWAQSYYNLEAPAFTGSDCLFVRLLEMKLDVIVGDSVWNPPDGVFDFDRLSQPGTFQNVENGFGFIGSGYRITEDVYPSRSVVTASCFAHASPCMRVGADCD